MSSTYMIFCLSHDPAIEAIGEYGTDKEVIMSASALAGHADCDVLIARYSGGLIELGCLGGEDLVSMPHGGWHRDVIWAEAGLLRVVAAVIATGDDGRAEIIAKALKRLPMCWTLQRLHRLRYVLGVA